MVMLLWGLRAPQPPSGEQPKDQDWVIRTTAPHEAADPLPAGEDCWTDYRDFGRRLTRRKEHEQAQRVHVVEPLSPGDRARIEEIEPQIYEARRG
jgi:hypothetical protein